jgi:predicted membrane-bound spermidine synthase/tetratricopeptide (TPR) repeat protein
MGGLAIGSAVWGRKADKISRPLLLYGWLEFGIGGYCLLYPMLIHIVKEIFFQSVTTFALQSDSAAVLGLKLIVSLLTVLPPTILMGGTLPVLVKTVSETVEESGRNVAVLYFLNSFGAVVGSILCGFFFIRLLGLSTTMYAGACINLLIGFAAFLLSRKVPATVEKISTPSPNGPRIFSKPEITAAIAVAGISGIAAMIYEVTWVRLLIPVFGSSTSSFSLMLIAFISGITIGSWVVSKVMERIHNLFSFLSICQFGVAFGLCASLPLYGRIPYIFWNLSTLLAKTETTYPIFLSLECLFCFLIMAIPTVFLGMTLPIASRIATRDAATLGSSVGNVFSVNTIGTVVGSLTAGLILIPAVGVRHAIEVGISLNVAAAMIVLLRDKSRKAFAKAVMVGITLAVAGIYFSVASDWNQLVMLSGVFRHVSERQAPPRSFEEFVSGVRDKKDFYYKEGTTATVAVVEAEVRGIRQKILLINGKGDASSVGDLSTQVLLGQLPMMFHPHANSSLVIGLGSGVTVGSILSHPVQSVDCVEISPEVIEASKYFASANNNALNDPRVAVHTEDALAYLQLSAKKYDVIVSEPSNPWIAGIGNLYTTEFFRACKNRLKNGGIMAQWFHIYEIDDDILKLVMRTFCGVFSHVTLWQTMSDDVVFVGTDSSLTLDVEMLRQKFQDEKIRTDLARVLVVDIPSLLSTQILSDGQCREYAGYGALNTEDKPFLEYASPRAFFINKGVPEFLTYDERLKFSDDKLLIQSYDREYGVTDSAQLNIGMLQSSQWWRNMQFAYSVLSQYNRKHPADLKALLTLAEVAEQLGLNEEAISCWKTLSALQPNNPSIIAKYAWITFAYHRPMASALSANNFEESENLLLRCITLTADTVDRYHIILGDIYFESQKYPEAAQHYLRAAELRKAFNADPHVSLDALFAKLAKALYYSGNNTQALEFAVQASLWNPASEEMKDLIYKIVMKQSAVNRKTSSDN